MLLYTNIRWTVHPTINTKIKHIMYPLATSEIKKSLKALIPYILNLPDTAESWRSEVVARKLAIMNVNEISWTETTNSLENMLLKSIFLWTNSANMHKKNRNPAKESVKISISKISMPKTINTGIVMPFLTFFLNYDNLRVFVRMKIHPAINGNPINGRNMFR